MAAGHVAHDRLAHEEQRRDPRGGREDEQRVGLEAGDVVHVAGVAGEIEELDVPSAGDLGELLAELGDRVAAAFEPDERVDVAEPS